MKAPKTKYDRGIWGVGESSLEDECGQALLLDPLLLGSRDGHETPLGELDVDEWPKGDDETEDDRELVVLELDDREGVLTEGVDGRE